jgi:acetyl-CoA synthetase
VLKARGVTKGDRVTIYLPMIPEAAYAMLACARIGAIHSVVFGGFSPDSLAGRIEDAGSTVVVTADEGLRGGRKVPLKANADVAADRAGRVASMVVVRRTGAAVDMKAGRDVYYDEIARTVPAECPCEPVNAEDPLFILYTSGSTGKPKGVLHTSGGYLVFAAMTHQYVFDYHDGDIFWCTADVGWVTGHSYIVYGPLANGATTLMFEGVPNHPTNARFWEVIDKHKVNIFYTAPTAIRALMQAGDARQPAAARLGRRADQSGSLGMVLPRGRRAPLPGGRHVVADRDRRHPDHAAAGRDEAQAGLGDAAVLRGAAGNRRCRRQGAGGRRHRQSVHRRFLARADAHRLWRP